MGENSKISWTIIEGFPDYAVDRAGNVYSRVKPGRWGGRVPWHRLKPSIHKLGYARVSLGKGNTRFIHELVLTTFVGLCPRGKVGRHRNGNPLCNRLSNLRWGTPKKNMDDQYRHGTRVAGERHPGCKLSEPEVLDIRQKWNTGKYKQYELAELFVVTQGRISMIVNRKARVTDAVEMAHG